MAGKPRCPSPNTHAHISNRKEQYSTWLHRSYMVLRHGHPSPYWLCLTDKISSEHHRFGAVASVYPSFPRSWARNTEVLKDKFLNPLKDTGVTNARDLFKWQKNINSVNKTPSSHIRSHHSHSVFYHTGSTRQHMLLFLQRLPDLLRSLYSSKILSDNESLWLWHKMLCTQIQSQATKV